MFDTMIIGAGVTGMAIAHFLSKTELSVLAVEAKEDVAEGATKANSAIVHAGYDAKPGTLKAKYNVEGNRMYPALAKQLGFPFINNGSLILCFKEEDRPELEALYQRGIQNGVEKLEILTREQVLEMIRSGACGTFNPKLLDRFFAVEDELSKLYQNGCDL